MPDNDEKTTALIEFQFESRLCDMEAAALAQMARQSWLNNLRSGVTGEMRIEERRVAQVIEGTVDAVLPMVARILADRRHTAIETTALGPIDARRFADWRVHGLPAESAAACDRAAAGAIMLFPASNPRGAAVAARRTA